MDSIALINTSEARIHLRSIGFITRHLSLGPDYLIVNFDKKTVVSSIFTYTEQLLNLDQAAPLLLLPDSISRSIYLLSTKQITRFNPRLTQEVLDEYCAALNTSVL